MEGWPALICCSHKYRDSFVTVPRDNIRSECRRSYRRSLERARAAYPYSLLNQFLRFVSDSSFNFKTKKNFWDNLHELIHKPKLEKDAKKVCVWNLKKDIHVSLLHAVLGCDTMSQLYGVGENLQEILEE